uniref:Uncharacterized protein n=1 Tax=Coccolithus braarudii TaxID=221442 RepID=A0A7S0KZW9_9EUKA|mmetsp:Transcript_12452/g.26874  ORF Transcript_12452/g.26874 Transcript_12452/m.26874 type:complete len:192 (+) Transcript_12452:11-586(+)
MKVWMVSLLLIFVSLQTAWTWTGGGSPPLPCGRSSGVVYMRKYATLQPLRLRPLVLLSAQESKETNESSDQTAAEAKRDLRAQLQSKQHVIEKRGRAVLGMVFALIIWFFTLPPDIRRARVCLGDKVGADKWSTLFACTPPAAMFERIGEHYRTCGDLGACVHLDLSIDPTSRAIFADAIDTLMSNGFPHL